MTDGEFIPDEAKIDEDGENIKISFRRDNGASREVSLPKKWLPGFVAQLVSKIEAGQMVPISRGDLQVGRQIAVQGWTIAKHPSGGRRLVLFVDLDDRVVTIPLELDASDVKSLISELS